jgi:hypothetical protein
MDVPGRTYTERLCDMGVFGDVVGALRRWSQAAHGRLP